MLFILIVAGLLDWAFWQFDNAGKMSGRRIKADNERADAINENAG